MNIVGRYLFTTILGTTAMVLAVLGGLGSFIEMVGQLDDIGVGGYGMVSAIAWVLMKLPTVLVQLLPIAVLLGALLGVLQHRFGQSVGLQLVRVVLGNLPPVRFYDLFVGRARVHLEHSVGIVDGHAGRRRCSSATGGRALLVPLMGSTAPNAQHGFHVNEFEP